MLLANIDGFWEPLLALLAHMRETEFIRPNLQVDILKAERVEDILPRLRAAAALATECARKSRRNWRAGFRNYPASASSSGNVTASMRLPSGSMTNAA